jgi:hypothetical protein
MSPLLSNTGLCIEGPAALAVSVAIYALLTRCKKQRPADEPRPTDEPRPVFRARHIRRHSWTRGSHTKTVRQP